MTIEKLRDIIMHLAFYTIIIMIGVLFITSVSFVGYAFYFIGTILVSPLVGIALAILSVIVTIMLIVWTINRFTM